MAMPDELRGKASGWYNIGNLSGGGLSATIAIWMIGHDVDAADDRRDARRDDGAAVARSAVVDEPPRRESPARARCSVQTLRDVGTRAVQQVRADRDRAVPVAGRHRGAHQLLLRHVEALRREPEPRRAGHRSRATSGSPRSARSPAATCAIATTAACSTSRPERSPRCAAS